MNFQKLELLGFGIIFSFTIFFPYTKVEESFNIQAIHDILYHRSNLTEYDHNNFPGVVPRTFIGPLVIATLSAPAVGLMSFLQVQKRYSQYVVRLMLGFMVWVCLIRFKRAVDTIWGKRVGLYFLIITHCQFHLLFYASRTLPNIFSLIFVLSALTAYQYNQMASFIVQAGAAILIFRSELCIFFGPYLILALYYRRLSILRFFFIAIPAAVCILGLTILVDSFFWQRWVWPEGEVFWFNVILNKSSEWGSLPFHWYFTSALPRALLSSLVYLPVGMTHDHRAALFTLPALLFVAVYSLLPHKELRFIIYAVPVINIGSAIGFTRCLTDAQKRPAFVNNIFHWVSIFLVMSSLLAVCIFATASMTNYPGGTLFARMHDVIRPDQEVNVHICNFGAQTGITRFLQENAVWKYNKTEGLESSPDILTSHFTHLLVELSPEGGELPKDPRLQPYLASHSLLLIEHIFSRITLRYPFIQLEPKLVLLQRNPIPKP